ncbi:hypothetical protein BU16DRAFT_161670 [Lophium mytilinum]|uniref:Uncharacterized protein n=1 Tax=Lophium mytilinum TaxID=390894 RepID=A0A6A6QDU4_9PEZI|nr:hypothetical protein BU16DRAFT_161670 [Lophium mytilinum]
MLAVGGYSSIWVSRMPQTHRNSRLRGGAGRNIVPNHGGTGNNAQNTSLGRTQTWTTCSASDQSFEATSTLFAVMAGRPGARLHRRQSALKHSGTPGRRQGLAGVIGSRYLSSPTPRRRALVTAPSANHVSQHHSPKVIVTSYPALHGHKTCSQRLRRPARQTSGLCHLTLRLSPAGCCQYGRGTKSWLPWPARLRTPCAWPFESAANHRPANRLASDASFRDMGTGARLTCISRTLAPMLPHLSLKSLVVALVFSISQLIAGTGLPTKVNISRSYISHCHPRRIRRL